jgi:hypothetical protein
MIGKALDGIVKRSQESFPGFSIIKILGLRITGGFIMNTFICILLIVLILEVGLQLYINGITHRTNYINHEKSIYNLTDENKRLIKTNEDLKEQNSLLLGASSFPAYVISEQGITPIKKEWRQLIIERERKKKL